MLIAGGAIAGYCETGSRVIESAPAIMTMPVADRPASDRRGGMLMSLSMFCFILNDTVTKLLSTKVGIGEFVFLRGLFATAMILGLGRAIGEAIAVTQVIGNSVAINKSLFLPGDTLASRIAGQYQGADTALQVSSLVYLAVILLVFSLVTNIIAQIVVRRVAGRHHI